MSPITGRAVARRQPDGRPMGRPDTVQNSNGLGRPKIQTIQTFFGLSRTARIYTYTRVSLSSEKN
jgi:hypothetical protein